MNITHEKTDALNARIKVEVNPEDYSDQVKKTYREYAQKANIKGFRKGKVPTTVIKRMYGEGVVLEELNKILSAKLEEYINGGELNIVGEPLPTTSDIKLDPDAESSYEFEYEVGISPEFSVNFDVKEVTPLYDIVIDNEMLDEEIDNIRARYGEVSNPEISGEGDVLFGKLQEIDDEGNAVEEGWHKMFAMSPERVQTKKLIKEMVGKKEGDTLEVTMKNLFEDEDAVRRFWERNVSGEYVRDISDDDLKALKKAKFQFEVRKINHIERAELNKELFDKVVVTGEIENEQQFREKVESDLEKFFEGEARKYFEGKMVEKLIEASDIPLPDDFLKKYLVKSRDKVTDDNVNDYYDDYAKNLRWELIIKKIMGDNPELELTHEKIEARAKEVVSEQYKPLLPNATEEQLQHFAIQMMGDEKTFNRLANEVLSKNIFGYIQENVKPESLEITASEFLKLK